MSLTDILKPDFILVSSVIYKKKIKMFLFSSIFVDFCSCIRYSSFYQKINKIRKNFFIDLFLTTSEFFPHKPHDFQRDFSLLAPTWAGRPISTRDYYCPRRKKLNEGKKGTAKHRFCFILYICQT